MESKSESDGRKELITSDVLCIEKVLVFPLVTGMHYDDAASLISYVPHKDLYTLRQIQACLESVLLVRIQPEAYQVGIMVVALWPKDNKYYRAVIVGIHGDDKLLVKYIDYGNYANNVNEVFDVPEDIENFPPCARDLKIDAETYESFNSSNKQTIALMKDVFLARAVANNQPAVSDDDSHKLANALLEELVCQVCYNHISSPPIQQ